MKTPYCLLWLSIFFSIFFSCSKTVNLNLQEFKEYRSSFQKDSQIKFIVKLNDIEIDESCRVKITDAIGIDEVNDSLHMVGQLSDWQHYNNSFGEYKFNLKAPKRSTKKIAKINGTLKVLTPSEKKKSKLTLKNFALPTKTNLLAEHYKKPQIFVIDSFDFDSAIEEARALYRKQVTIERAFPPSEEELEEDIARYEKVLNWGKIIIEAEHNIHFLIDDPNDQIIDLDIYDGSGVRQNAGLFYLTISSPLPPLKPRKVKQKDASTYPVIRTIALKEEPKEDWILKIILENKSSVQEYKFEIRDITLH